MKQYKKVQGFTNINVEKSQNFSIAFMHVLWQENATFAFFTSNEDDICHDIFLLRPMHILMQFSKDVLKICLFSVHSFLWF